MFTIVTIAIRHAKPMPDLPELAAGRAWTIDGVEEANVLASSVTPGLLGEFPVKAVPLPPQPDEISSRWADAV